MKLVALGLAQRRYTTIFINELTFNYAKNPLSMWLGQHLCYHGHAILLIELLLHNRR